MSTFVKITFCENFFPLEPNREIKINSYKIKDLFVRLCDCVLVDQKFNYKNNVLRKLKIENKTRIMKSNKHVELNIVGVKLKLYAIAKFKPFQSYIQLKFSVT